MTLKHDLPEGAVCILCDRPLNQFNAALIHDRDSLYSWACKTCIGDRELTIEAMADRLDYVTNALNEAKDIFNDLIATRPPRSMGAKHDDALSRAQRFLERHPIIILD